MSSNRIFVAILVALAPSLVYAQGTSTVRVTETVAVVEQPDGSASSVGTANAGQVLEVLDQRNGWLLVRPLEGSPRPWRTGWINAASTQPMTGVATNSGNGGAAQPADTQPPARAGRKGFIIGLGAGVGMHRFTEPTIFNFRGVPVGGGGTYNGVGLAWDFNIGYAPTDRLLIHYTNAVQFGNDSNYDIVGLTGAGVTYAFKPTARSWYVSGAIGAATGAEVDLGSGRFGDVERGLAFSAGGGYEFARHWLLGGTAMFLELDGATHTVIRGTITWMFY